MPSTFSRIAVVGLSLAVFGAGCPQPPVANRPTKTGVSATQGFGKLPSVSVSQYNTAATGASKALSPSLDAVAPQPVSAPSALPMMAEGSGGGVAVSGRAVATPAVISARPIPYPQPRPVTVEYTISAALPSWDSSSDVLQVVRQQPELSAVMTLARAGGVPSQTTDGASSIQSASLSWRDQDALTWTLDTNSRTLSMWKDQSGQTQPPEKLPDVPQDTVLMIASSFLRAHGFAALASAEGKIQDQQFWAMRGEVKATGASTPCPVPLEDQAGGAGAPSAMMKDAAVNSVAPVQSMLYPNPCGWWPQQVSVVYSSARDGKNVVDAGGNPFQNATITVDLATKSVSGGYIQLDEQTNKSSYPLIDAETAKKRLQSGGLNPVYPWGESSTIKVSLTMLSIVWMRYDSWQDGTNHTYYLPALLATGKINRGVKGQEAEDYRTLVPLVADDAFDMGGGTIYPPGPIPVPMMETQTINAQPPR